MFRKIKHTLIKQKKIGDYLKYAFGEIVLIVTGILVAVSINNWNGERQQKNALNGIFSVIINDIKTDTAEVNKILQYYNSKEATFHKVMNDTLTKKEIIECTDCPRLITGRRLLNINSRGFQQLNGYSIANQNQKDSLIFDIIHFYTTINENVIVLNDLINKDIIGNLSYWRDTYPWFVASIQGKLNKEDLVYFTNNQEYKNKVAFHYTLIYENYVPVLKAYLNSADILLKKMPDRLQQ